MFSSNNKLKITERSNIRVTENGVYRGLTYNESRAVLDYMWFEDGYSQYAGNYYVYEASMKDTRLIANTIDLNEYCEIAITDQGRYKLPEEQLLPVLRDFPVFPDKEISPGDSWRDFGVRMVDPENSGIYTKVKFYCEYKYEGLKTIRTGLKHVITAQYALRYKPGDTKINDPDLKRISGRHMVTIMIDDEDRSSIFIRDTVDEQYFYFDGKVLEHKGFILTWYNDIIGMDRRQVAEKTRQEIETAEVKDVEIIEKTEGLALTVKNLHFVPDSAEILPVENGRIRSLFELLTELEVKKILVVGHTADVGTKESQYLLSEQRARAVIDKLSALGMNPGMFIYEGRGGDEPAASNETPEGRAANRRVELILLDD
jgi:outer membrane protein OmpA-like peptidoglycan-associated protein